MSGKIDNNINLVPRKECLPNPQPNTIESVNSRIKIQMFGISIVIHMSWEQKARWVE